MHQLTVYMQISKQLQWIPNNFNIHVTKAAVARVRVVCLLQKEYEKMGISFSLYLNLYICPSSQWERESFLSSMLWLYHIIECVNAVCGTISFIQLQFHCLWRLPEEICPKITMWFSYSMKTPSTVLHFAINEPHVKKLLTWTFYDYKSLWLWDFFSHSMSVSLLQRLYLVRNVLHCRYCENLLNMSTVNGGKKVIFFSKVISRKTQLV